MRARRACRVAGRDADAVGEIGGRLRDEREEGRQRDREREEYLARHSTLLGRSKYPSYSKERLGGKLGKGKISGRGVVIRRGYSREGRPALGMNLGERAMLKRDVLSGLHVSREELPVVLAD